MGAKCALDAAAAQPKAHRIERHARESTQQRHALVERHAGPVQFLSVNARHVFVRAGAFQQMGGGAEIAGLFRRGRV